ncbi:chemotaxis protein CheB [Sphingobacterium paludis]|uniref:protein-glutamate methylesterase n=1 Tax=Sphingobacterium paludis TaxID=1476465 RepID=A0A4R7CS74_9SPHI|nr:chemotaxis protein CheB [Sphingobacterium paludis]TDS07482.1 two-component system chemotaxis response regulator CheB [Sphingobacterium paludis]
MISFTGRKIELLVIGGSAGSLKVLLQLLPELRTDLPFPVVIVLHRKPDPDSVLDLLLKNYTQLDLLEAGDKMSLCKNTVYLAPPDYHLLFENKELVSLDCSEKLNYSRPSIDVSFQSAAQVFKKNLATILLSGANADGVEGLRYVKSEEGLIFVQDPSTAEVEYMPRQAILQTKVDAILRPDEFGQLINNLY